MLTRVPDYYEAFHCLAGACPHICCEKWEVIVDEETARLYQETPGPLGERLREALQTDEEGDFCFPLRGGRCPFLDWENLCEIHRMLGESATSATCREHPRFIEEYGPFREITLSASCPAANALLLGSRTPLAFRETETPGRAEAGDPWLAPLLALRSRMAALLTDRSRPLRQRLADLLTLAAEAQRLLDEDRAEALPALAEARPVPETRSPAGEPGLFPAALQRLETLEVLEPDWRTLLRTAAAASPAEADPALLERIGTYFLFRYSLKAVNDGDLMSWVEVCVFAVLVVERLAAVCGLPEALGRFSREIEHDWNNLEALREAFWTEEAVSLPRFLVELSR